jgi:acyl-CoA thioester hydrolase
VTAARIRITYADTDQMGVVYYANYLRFFEVGRAEWIRARGRPYRDLEAAGLKLPVVEAYARYRAPARYDDLVAIDVAPADVRRASLRFMYVLRREEDGLVLCEGHTLHASVGPDGRPRRLPDDVLRLLGGETHGS